MRVAVGPAVPGEVLEHGEDARLVLALGVGGGVAGDGVGVAGERPVADRGVVRLVADVDVRREVHRDPARREHPAAVAGDLLHLGRADRGGEGAGAGQVAVEPVDALDAAALVVDGHGERQPGRRLHAAQRLAGEQPGGGAADEDAADLHLVDQPRRRRRVGAVDADHEPLGQLLAGAQRRDDGSAVGQPVVAEREAVDLAGGDQRRLRGRRGARAPGRDDEQGEADDDGQPQHQREHRTTPEPQAAGPGDADARRPGVRATGSRAGAGGDEGGQPAPDAHPRRAEADARPMRESARAAVEARSVPRSARAGRFRSGAAREGDRAAARRPVPRTERTRVARVDAGRIRSGPAREGDRVPARRPVPRTERTRVARVGSIRSGITREGDRVPVGQAAQRDDGEATDGHRPVSAGTRVPGGRRARRAAGRGGARWWAARRPGRAPTRRARWG